MTRTFYASVYTIEDDWVQDPDSESVLIVGKSKEYRDTIIQQLITLKDIEILNFEIDTPTNEALDKMRTGLDYGDYIIMYFTEEDDLPSLTYFGLYYQHPGLIVVCTDNSKAKLYIEYICENHDIEFYNNLQDGIDHFKNYLASLAG